MTGLDRATIAALIPHAGRMCLLERVVSWDAGGITCHALGHRDPGNPMARDGVLPVLCGIEYAAQAMAVHGGLTAAGPRPSAGFLASLREVACHADRLDTLPAPLVVAAQVLLGEASRVVYRFSLHAEGREVLSGRAAVVLAA
ncbi:MAG TPA: hypothetical protein VGC80_02555 [Acetobacteraceae bacterium]